MIFGGYSSVKFPTIEEKVSIDNNAFLFSLTKQTKHKHNDAKKYAIGSHNGYLFGFNGGI